MNEATRRNYDNWREAEVHKVGAAVVRKAEAELDRQTSQPIVRIRDDATGSPMQVREEMGKRLVGKGTHSKPGGRKTFVMGRMPWRKYDDEEPDTTEGPAS